MDEVILIPVKSDGSTLQDLVDNNSLEWTYNNLIFHKIVETVKNYNSKGYTFSDLEPSTIIVFGDGDITIKSKMIYNKESNFERDQTSIYTPMIGKIFYFMKKRKEFMLGETKESINREIESGIKSYDIIKGLTPPELAFLRKCFIPDTSKTLSSETINDDMKELFVPEGIKVLGYGAKSIVFEKNGEKIKLTTKENQKREKKATVMFTDQEPAMKKIIKNQNTVHKKGTLTDYINSGESVTNHRIIEMFTAITEGLIVLEQRELIHRDIKPDNILLEDDLTPKIIDFDLARPFKSDFRKKSIAGTYSFIAPEVGTSEYDQKVDVFQLEELCTFYSTERFHIAVLMKKQQLMK